MKGGVTFDLGFVCFLGNESKVLEVLSQKPDMANIEDKDGATPLMFASNKGRCQVRAGPGVLLVGLCAYEKQSSTLIDMKVYVK
jgi:hypothetical protein